MKINDKIKIKISNNFFTYNLRNIVLFEKYFFIRKYLSVKNATEQSRYRFSKNKKTHMSIESKNLLIKKLFYNQIKNTKIH